jgi:transcriptional regulator with XRE-family HTH domain
MSDPLPLLVKRPPRDIPQGEWTWKSEAAAIAAAINSSGLQDKTVAVEIGVDNATLSKAQQGAARLSEQALNALMDCTGSEAWLFYWLVRRGYDPRSLRRIETDVERENRELRERLAQFEHDREVERKAFLAVLGKGAA